MEFCLAFYDALVGSAHRFSVCCSYRQVKLGKIGKNPIDTLIHFLLVGLTQGAFSALIFPTEVDILEAKENH